jgi:hypothetical protein
MLTRPAFPLPCNPRMERAPLGFFPDASNPAVTSNARQSGDGSMNTHPKLRCCHHTQPSNQRAHSCRATSCRTEEIEPIAQVGDAGLGLGELQPEPGQHHTCLFVQGRDVVPAAVGHDDEVVGITHDPPIARPLEHSAAASPLGGLLTTLGPGGMIASSSADKAILANSGEMMPP